MHGGRTNGPSIRPIVFLLLVLTSSSAVRVRRADGCGWCCSDTASPDRWCIVVAGRGDGRTARARRSRALDRRQRRWAVAGKVPVDARDTLLNSLHARVTLRRIGSRAPSSAAATTCLRRTVWHAHGPPRRRSGHDHENISRAGTSPSERAPVRKGPSPVGLAVAFALAPLTSQQQGRSAAGSPRLLRLAKRRTKLLLFTTSPASRPALPAAGQTSGHSASAVTACVNPHADAGGHA